MRVVSAIVAVFLIISTLVPVQSATPSKSESVEKKGRDVAAPNPNLITTSVVAARRQQLRRSAGAGNKIKVVKAKAENFLGFFGIGYAKLDHNFDNTKASSANSATSAGRSDRLLKKNDAARHRRRQPDASGKHGDVCNIDLFIGKYFYTDGCGGLSFFYTIECDKDDTCTVTDEVSSASMNMNIQPINIISTIFFLHSDSDSLFVFLPLFLCHIKYLFPSC